MLLGSALFCLTAYQLRLIVCRSEDTYAPSRLQAPSRIVNFSAKAKEPSGNNFSYYLVDEDELNSKLSPSPLLAPRYDIPLDLELQEHTYNLCQLYNVDYELVLAVMERESRFVVNIRDNVNDNGTRDRGLMQINQCNWGWLSLQGLDINVPEDNIEAGIMVISDYVEKYGETKALMAYQCGEARMLELDEQGVVTQYAADVLASRDFGLIPAQ